MGDGKERTIRKQVLRERSLTMLRFCHFCYSKKKFRDWFLQSFLKISSSPLPNWLSFLSLPLPHPQPPSAPTPTDTASDCGWGDKKPLSLHTRLLVLPGEEERLGGRELSWDPLSSLLTLPQLSCQQSGI